MGLLSLDALTQLAASGLFLLLAVILLFLNSRHRANQTFALFLVLGGFGYLTYSLGQAATGAQSRDWIALSPFFTLPLLFVITYFASIYPYRRGWFAHRWWAKALLATGALLVVVLYAVEPTLFWTLRKVPQASAEIPHHGPLYYAVAVPLFIAYAVIALLFGWEYTRTPPGTTRRSLRTVCLAATLYPLWVGTLETLRAFADPQAFTGKQFILFPIALLVLHFARHAMKNPDPEVRRKLRRFLAYLPAPVLSAVAAFWVEAAPLRLPFSLDRLLDGVWVLAVPVLVSYAIVKHQLFDIDLKIKWTIKQTTLLAIFIGVFFVVSESAAQFFQSQLGPYLGIAAAGLLVLFIAPLQSLAGKVSNVAMPSVRRSSDYIAFKKLEVYQATFENIWRDGAVTEKERRILENLREKLAIQPEDALQVEADVRTAMPPRTTKTPQRATAKTA